MAKRALPNLALVGAFTAGEDSWGDDMDANLLKLSVLVQAGVIDAVAAVPGAPAQGDVYLLTADPNNKSIAVFDGGAWTYLVPLKGWQVYNRAAGQRLTYDGAAWVPFVPGIAEAPNDGKTYVRQNKAWVAVTLPDNGPKTTYIQTGARSGQNGPYPVNMPAAPTKGNYLIALITSADWRATPASWTVIGDVDDPDGRLKTRFMYRLVGDGESAAVDVTTTGTDAYCDFVHEVKIENGTWDNTIVSYETIIRGSGSPNALAGDKTAARLCLANIATRPFGTGINADANWTNLIDTSDQGGNRQGKAVSRLFAAGADCDLSGINWNGSQGSFNAVLLKTR